MKMNIYHKNIEDYIEKKKEIQIYLINYIENSNIDDEIDIQKSNYFDNVNIVFFHIK